MNKPKRLPTERSLLIVGLIIIAFIGAVITALAFALYQVLFGSVEKGIGIALVVVLILFVLKLMDSSPSK
jgi:uncharacterized membrane protein YdbT with pleckstrin-like domain